MFSCFIINVYIRQQSIRKQHITSNNFHIRSFITDFETEMSIFNYWRNIAAAYTLLAVIAAKTTEVTRKSMVYCKVFMPFNKHATYTMFITCFISHSDNLFITW